MINNYNEHLVELFPNLSNLAADRLAQALLELPDTEGELTKSDLLKAEFLVAANGSREVYFVPFPLVCTNRQAKISIIGLTPGWHQMEIAYRQASKCLKAGGTLEDALDKARREASFKGSMRKNISSMLDEIGLAQRLGIETCQNLFDPEQQNLLDTTSLIRFPVFHNGKNYTGSGKLENIPHFAIFKDMLLAQLEQTDSIIVPMGKVVSTHLEAFCNQGAVDRNRCLLWFPHASGANGHRKKDFEKHLPTFRQTVANWSPSFT